jgi:hypothetical protein
VEPADEAAIQRSQLILGRCARLIAETTGAFDLSGADNVIDALVSILTCHPMSESDLLAALEKWFPGQSKQMFEDLSVSGKLQVVTRYGKRFWSVSQAKYHDPIKE